MTTPKQPIAKSTLELMAKLNKKGEEELWAISRDELDFTGEKFASGSGGDLFRLTFRGLDCVGKTCPLTVKNQVLSDLANEIKVLSSLRHPNLVMFLGACFEPPEKPPVLLMEYCEGGNLESKLIHVSADGGKLKQSLAMKYSYQLALALHFLHSCKPSIVHRDLKPSNILLTSDNSLKVTDFGLSKFIPKRTDSGKQSDKYVMTGETGSYRFMAPEVLRHQEYNSSVDVYSYALILYWIWSGYRPFSSIKDPIKAAQAAAEGKAKLNYKLFRDNKLRTLMYRSSSLDPDERPEFKEILAVIKELKDKPKKGSCRIQ